jgi:CBS domain-containing protein
MKKISDCMSKDVQIAEADQTIRQAAQSMARLDAGVMPVREGDRLVGMITDRDIAIRGVAMGKGPDTEIRDVMSTDVKYCYDDEEVEEVLHSMGDLQVRRLPVLNRSKRLVGIISLGDLAKIGETVETGKALSGISKPGGEHSQTGN